MASAKVAILITFALLYFGLSLFFLGKGIIYGEVTNSRDALQIVNPIGALNNYNDWLKSSYDLRIQYEENIAEGGDPSYINEQEMGIRNANFGMTVSIFAILIFISALAMAAYLFMPNGAQWFMLAILISLGLTYALFSGLEGILYVLNGVI